jgi:hypothetical protein
MYWYRLEIKWDYKKIISKRDGNDGNRVAMEVGSKGPQLPYSQRRNPPLQLSL